MEDVVHKHQNQNLPNVLYLMVHYWW